MQRIDDLQRGGLRIIQDDKGFRFGTDAVLLADFAAIKPGERVCDMGTGTGVLPLLLSARAEGTTFDAFEVQRDVADMAQRSVALNGLQARIRVHHADCPSTVCSSFSQKARMAPVPLATGISAVYWAMPIMGPPAMSL